MIILIILSIEFNGPFSKSFSYFLNTKPTDNIIKTVENPNDLKKNLLIDFIIIDKNQLLDITANTTIFVEDDDISKDIFIIGDDKTIEYYKPGFMKTINTSGKLEIFFYDKPFNLFIKKNKWFI